MLQKGTREPIEDCNKRAERRLQQESRKRIATREPKEDCNKRAERRLQQESRKKITTREQKKNATREQKEDCNKRAERRLQQESRKKITTREQKEQVAKDEGLKRHLSLPCRTLRWLQTFLRIPLEGTTSDKVTIANFPAV